MNEARKCHQRDCKECGCDINELQSKEGGMLCYQCHAMILRCYRLQSRLPDNLEIQEVKRKCVHRKPCSDCGSDDWWNLGFYVYEGVQKYCIDCAELKNWESSNSSEEVEYKEEEEDDDEAINFLDMISQVVTQDKDSNQEMKKQAIKCV